MAHEIKINRSKNLAPHVPSAQADIDSAISPYLLERLTAAELAEVRRCLDAHWHRAIAFAERQALAEAGMWDQQRGIFRELARIN